jgi:hypothetical protein
MDDSKRSLVHFFYCSAVIFLLSLTIFNLNLFFQPKKVLGITNSDRILVQQRNFWKDFLSHNSSYIEGWLELSRIEKILGNIEASLEAKKKAYEIDPNF